MSGEKRQKRAPGGWEAGEDERRLCAVSEEEAAGDEGVGGRMAIEN